MNLQSALQHRALVEAFLRKHRVGVLTMVFTDIVGATRMMQGLGDYEAIALLHEHHTLIRRILIRFEEAQEISTAGDSFFIVFTKPSDAVRFALIVQARLRAFGQETGCALKDRIGIHVGEVLVEAEGDSTHPTDLYGLQVDACQRVMSIGQADQILLTRFAFDNARQALRGQDIEGVGPLAWLNHGPYLLKGLDEPLEICEVGETGVAVLAAPATSDKGRRCSHPEGEVVVGWRPALDQTVPGTHWVLEEKLGEGGFGEVWRGRHQTLKECRVFKFCFRADRVRTLKREVTLFRVLKERVGEHPNIVRLLEVSFDEPPYYIEMDYVPGKDLVKWCHDQGGIGKVTMPIRLEIVAQVADALQSAHDAGVIHRDVKPSNILVSGELEGADSGTPSEAASSRKDGRPSPPVPHVKITDFGIGQVVSQEVLKSVTRSGFTQTLVAEASSRSGTQLYMAPELLAGEHASIRSDIYSLGVVAYQLLVGDLHRPLTTDWADSIADPLLREDLKHCFAGNPEDRFAGAAQLARQLRSWEKRRGELAEQQTRQAAREKAAYRRGTLRAAAVGVLVALVMALLAVRAYHSADQEARQRLVAEQQRQRAVAGELTALRSAYAADMNLAQLALDASNLGRAAELLKRNVPSRGGRDLRGWEWHYLWRQCQSDASYTLLQHSDPIYSVSFSSDGSELAVGGFDGAVELWDLAGRRRLATLEQGGEGGALTYELACTLLFSPKDRTLAATGPGSVLKLWDTQRRAEIARFSPRGRASSLAFSADGKRVAAYGQDGNLSVWDIPTGRTLATYPVARARGFEGAVVFSPDGSRVYVGEPDGRIRVLDAATGQEMLLFSAHSNGVTTLALSPDGRLLASGARGLDSTNRLWLAATGHLFAELAGHQAWIRALAFSPDGRTLASASADQTIRIWDIETKKQSAVLRGHSFEVWALAMSRDGQTLASGGKDGSVMLWNVRPETRTEAFTILRGECRAAVFSPDSRTLVILDGAGAVTTWDVATARQSGILPGLGTNNVGLLFDLSGGRLIVGDRTGATKVWDWSRQAVLTNLMAGVSWAAPPRLTANGRLLMTLDADAGVTVWNTSSWSPSASWKARTNVSSFDLSADGRLAVLGHQDGLVSFVDASSGRELSQSKGRRNLVGGVAFSSDGRLLATGSQDATARLWNPASRTETAVLRGHLKAVHSVAFSPDGRRLATGGDDKEAVKLWDLDTRQEVLTLHGQGTAYRLLRFSPNGSALLAVSGENKAHFWRVTKP